MVENMNAKSKIIDDKIYFDNYVVVKESDNFYGVYPRFSRFYLSYNKNYLITSSTTKNNACKKAKLLQIGYDMALSNME
jgi:hypothetical protein